MKTKDPQGDICKEFEAAAERRAMPRIPLLIRLDGRAFHTFTRGLARPFDARFHACMREAASAVIDDLRPNIAYTQSDEITLVWASDQAVPFAGRFQKLASISASIATAAFNAAVRQYLPEKSHLRPIFDARVWQVPTNEDAIEVLRWREADATKNSLQMLARAYYSHSALHGKSGRQMHDMLHEKGINWNNLEAWQKRGTYLRRETVELVIEEEARLRIPEAHRPEAGALVQRTRIIGVDMPPLTRLSNPVLALLYGFPPRTYALSAEISE